MTLPSNRRRRVTTGDTQLMWTPPGTVNWPGLSLSPWTPTGPMGYQRSEDEREWPIHYLDEIEPANRYRIMLPVIDRAIDADHEPTKRLAETAGAFAQVHDGELLVLGVVTIPDQTPLSTARESSFVTDKLISLQQIVGHVSQSTDSVKGVCVLARDRTTAVLYTCRHSDCDALLIGVAPEHPGRRLLRRDPVETMLARAECDTYITKPSEFTGPPNRMLLAVSKGPHSGLATQAARTLAIGYDINEITVLHAVEAGADEEQWTEAGSIVNSARRTLEDVSIVNPEIVEVENTRKTIIDRATGHGLTVLGAPTVGLLKRLAFGSVPDTVQREAVGTVLTALSHESLVENS